MSHYRYVTTHPTYVTVDPAHVAAGVALVTAEATNLDRMVDDAGMDSFPASDPPSWWSGVEPGGGGEM